MKIKLSLLFIAIISYSCSQNQNKTQNSDLSIIGTWELISATATQKDSTFSTFNPKVKMIKIINPDILHFSLMTSPWENKLIQNFLPVPENIL